jgi:hypothetical protein
MTKYNFGFRRKDNPEEWLKIYNSLPEVKERQRKNRKLYRQKKSDDLAFLEKEKFYVREWHAKNKEKVKRYKKTNAKREAQRQREYLLKRKYNITSDQYEEMLQAQNGVCWICASGPGGRWNRLFVDHDHSTGRVRGLLCHLCNTALNRVDNYKEKIEAYLKAHK